MRTAGVVVTYYPDEEALKFNISSYIGRLDALMVWINTPGKTTEDYRFLVEAYPEKLILRGSGDNEGIAYALNRAVEWAKKEEFDFLLSMDQDSYFIGESFGHYLDKVYENNFPDVVMYVSMLRGVGAESPEFEGDFREYRLFITSGTLMPLKVFDLIGNFREDLFIEGVDLEMCWRSKAYKLRILQVAGAYLMHSVGDRKEFRFMGRKLHTYNYAPVRVYYSTRNHIYLYRLYRDRAFFKKFLFNNILKKTVSILLFEKNKGLKLKAMCYGLKDGWRGKLGKCNFL